MYVYKRFRRDSRHFLPIQNSKYISWDQLENGHFLDSEDLPILLLYKGRWKQCIVSKTSAAERSLIFLGAGEAPSMTLKVPGFPFLNTYYGHFVCFMIQFYRLWNFPSPPHCHWFLLYYYNSMVLPNQSHIHLLLFTCVLTL